MQKKQLWILQYAPKALGECAGNEEPREQLRQWANAWEAGKGGKPLLLSGPTGVGKSAAARALANEMGWQLVESDASQARDKEAIAKVFGATGSSMGLFGSRRLLVIDEVDAGLERGGAAAIAAFAGKASQPVLLIANDAWNQKISALRNECRMVDFKAVNATAVKKVLERIAKAEGVANAELISQIAQECDGDLRAAITDLQSGFAASRERKKNIFRIVSKIFKAASYGEAMRAADESEVDFDMLLRWIEENIPAEYEKTGEIALAYQQLSRADEFRGRILRRQNYRMLKYVRVLAVAGVCASKQGRYSKFTKYNFPSIIKKLSAAREARVARKSAFGKVGRAVHCSPSQAAETLEMLAGVDGASEYFGLEEKEAGLFVAPKKLVGKKAGNKKDKGVGKK